ncbi:MAG: SMR family transporter [Firmicutes bacterium]|nr:SMR family transporter [Bacillota bacterium]
MFYFLIVAIGLIDFISSILLRYWAGNGKPLLLVTGVFGFAMVGLLFAFSMKYQGLAVANILWTACAVIFCTIAGMFLFKEHLSVSQIIGTLLILTGLVFVIK